jgi:hypothetical protein
MPNQSARLRIRLNEPLRQWIVRTQEVSHNSYASIGIEVRIATVLGSDFIAATCSGSSLCSTIKAPRDMNGTQDLVRALDFILFGKSI